MGAQVKSELTCSRTRSDDKSDVDEALDPEVGMEFENEDDVYSFYNKHARKIGFSIRKNWRTADHKTGVVKTRRYVCSKEGHRVPDKRDGNVKHHRDETRTGCEAYMLVRLQLNGKYRITETNLLHNHPLATPNQVHLLRSQKKLAAEAVASKDCVSPVNIVKNVKFKSREAYDFDQENLERSNADSTCFLRFKRMKAMERFDAGGLLDYFKIKQLQDPSFFYSIQTDTGDHITNIFWLDGRMLIEYEHFGDVVCFDTAYKTEEYGRPFAPFIGVNHHRQIVIFGAAFIYDETLDSYRWLLRTFFVALSGKMPKVIFTDQNKIIENAIKMELGEVVHRVSVWHLHQNALKQLSNVFLASRSFSNDFSKCIYDCEEEEEFLQSWDNMIQKYGLVDNAWLQQLFAERKKWALVYGREMFSADINKILQNENLSKELKSYLHPTQTIIQFLEDFQRLVDERFYVESIADFKMSESSPKVIVPVDILIHASSIYTSNMFEIFQTEFVSGLNCIVKGCYDFGTVKKYEVVDGKGYSHVVTLDSMDEATVTCSCKKYEFIGILCGHVLRVIGNTVRFVPSKYIFKRWTREASVLKLKPSSTGSISEDGKKVFLQRYNHLFLNFVKLAARASESEEAYQCVTIFLDRMWKNIEMALQNGAIEERSKDIESSSDEVVAVQDDSLKLTVDDLQFKEVNECRRKIGSGSGTRNVIGFFEKPFASNSFFSSACPTPLYYPVPTTPPTLFFQGNSPHELYKEPVYNSNLNRDSSLFGTSQQFLIGSGLQERSKE